MGAPAGSGIGRGGWVGALRRCLRAGHPALRLVLRTLVADCTLAADYAEVGRDVAATIQGETVATSMEIGTVVYFCDSCQLHEPFTDPALGQATIDHSYAQAGPVTGG